MTTAQVGGVVILLATAMSGREVNVNQIDHLANHNGGPVLSMSEFFRVIACRGKVMIAEGVRSPL